MRWTGIDQPVALDDQGRPLYQSLIEGFARATEDARTENERRYYQALQGTTPQGESLGDFDQRNSYDGMLARAQETGDQLLKDIQESWKNSEYAGYQDLVSRGLTGTTIKPTMQMGYQRQANADVNRARQQNNDYYNQLAQARLGFIERRQDQYPNPEYYLQLAQAMGQYPVWNPYR